MSFSVGRPFELSWNIRIDDLRVDIGKIKFDHVVDPSSFVGDEDSDAENTTIQVTEVGASWRGFVLPILINELNLADEPMSKHDILGAVPAYEEASFVIEGGWVDIWWSLKGCGFGNYFLRTTGGYPHLHNECMNKGTILKVFQEIALPQGY